MEHPQVAEIDLVHGTACRELVLTFLIPTLNGNTYDDDYDNEML